MTIEEAQRLLRLVAACEAYLAEYAAEEAQKKEVHHDHDDHRGPGVDSGTGGSRVARKKGGDHEDD